MVLSEKSSNLATVVSCLRERSKLGSGQIPILRLEPLKRRTECANDIFQEGELLSGIAREGDAIACLTLPASPHVAPLVPASEFLLQASKVFGKKSSLSLDTGSDTKLSPQLVLWWNKVEPTERDRLDFLGLYKLPAREQEDFCKVIAYNAQKGVEVIEEVSDKPFIWGSWGFASAEERERLGKSRGCPTNELGHCHIAFFDGDAQPVEFVNNLDTPDQLNHYGPWNYALISRYGIPLGKRIARIAEETLGFQNECSFEIFSDFKKMQTGALAFRDGIALILKDPVDLQAAFNIVIQVAGKIEDWYQHLSTLYEDYYKSLGNLDLNAKIMKDMIKINIQFGFTEEEAKDFAKFLLRIKPTYGQILRFQSDNSKKSGEYDPNLEEIEKIQRRYDKIRRRIENARGLSVNALVKDTCMYPNPHTANEFTWPVHSSVCFMIDNYDAQDGRISVRSLKFFPSIASTESIPQREVGAVLRRAA